MARLLFLSGAAALAAAQAPPSSSVITVDWAAISRPLQTVVGFQTVRHVGVARVHAPQFSSRAPLVRFPRRSSTR